MLDLIQPKVRTIIRKIKQTSDDNFIGFDKYTKKGAYHWEELVDNEYYRAKVEVVSSYLSEGHNCLDIGCGDGAYATFQSLMNYFRQRQTRIQNRHLYFIN